MQNLPGFRGGAGERFFAENVLAGFERGDDLPGMERRGGAEVNQINFRVGEKFVQLAKRLDAPAQMDIAGFFDVSRHAGQDAADGQPRRVAHRDDARGWDRQISAQMRHAHEAQAGDDDVDFGRSLAGPIFRLCCHKNSSQTKLFFGRSW